MNYILVGVVTIAVVLLAIGLGVGLSRALRTYLKFRGKRIVSCPETHQAAAVRVAAGNAALKATIGHDELRLKECSRWPEREAVRARVLATDRRSAEGVSGFDDRQSLVSGQGVRVLPQAVWRTALGHASAGADGRAAQDGAVERNPRGEAAGNDADAFAGVLGLPYRRDVPARTSGNGGGPGGRSATHERL